MQTPSIPDVYLTYYPIHLS